MLQILTNQLKAAVLMAATKDVRHYINSVCIQVDEDGEVHIKSTDGAVAFEDVAPTKCETQKGPFEIIIPIDAAKVAAKTKGPVVQLCALTGGKYQIADTVFSPVDGRFPDTDRIFARRDSSFDNTVAHYNFELLARCQLAMRLATGTTRFFRIQNSPVGLMCRETETFPRCAVQPLSFPRCFVDN